MTYFRSTGVERQPRRRSAQLGRRVELIDTIGLIGKVYPTRQEIHFDANINLNSTP